MLSKNDLNQIREVVQQEVSDEVSPLKKDVKTLKSDVFEIRRDVKRIVNFFDREYLELRKRVENIEEHLGISSPSN